MGGSGWGGMGECRTLFSQSGYNFDWAGFVGWQQFEENIGPLFLRAWGAVEGLGWGVVFFHSKFNLNWVGLVGWQLTEKKLDHFTCGWGAWSWKGGGGWVGMGSGEGRLPRPSLIVRSHNPPLVHSVVWSIVVHFMVYIVEYFGTLWFIAAHLGYMTVHFTILEIQRHPKQMILTKNIKKLSFEFREKNVIQILILVQNKYVCHSY